MNPRTDVDFDRHSSRGLNMLLCCFREPKEAKSTSGHNSPYTKTNSQTRPLKTTPATPISLSSNNGNNEILVASVTLENRPRHSFTSYTSERCPSRDGSDRRLAHERAPLGTFINNVDSVSGFYFNHF